MPTLSNKLRILSLVTCHLKQPCFYLMRGLPSAIQFNIVTSSSTLFVMALPELALKSLRVPGWNVNVIEYRHTARGARLLNLQNCSDWVRFVLLAGHATSCDMRSFAGILGGLMEASRSEDAADPQLHFSCQTSPFVCPKKHCGGRNSSESNLLI